MDREPLPEYFRRFVQKKAQTPNFSEKDAIAKFIEGLLPSQLASHLDREPPRSLSELYAEIKKRKVRSGPQMKSGTKEIDEATAELAAKQPSQTKSTSIHTSCGTFARHGSARRVRSLHNPTSHTTFEGAR